MTFSFRITLQKIIIFTLQKMSLLITNCIRSWLQSFGRLNIWKAGMFHSLLFLTKKWSNFRYYPCPTYATDAVVYTALFYLWTLPRANHCSINYQHDTRQRCENVFMGNNWRRQELACNFMSMIWNFEQQGGYVWTRYCFQWQEKLNIHAKVTWDLQATVRPL